MPAPIFRLKQRDKYIFMAIYGCQMLTTPQISARFFPPETRQASANVRSNKDISSGCRRRLKRLTNEEYLYRRELPTTSREGKKPYLYFLTKRSVKVVADELSVPVKELKWRPSQNEIRPSSIAHCVAINDVRLSIGIDAEAQSFMLTDWMTEHKLKQYKLKGYLNDSRGRKHKKAFLPDGFFCLFVPDASGNAGISYPNFIEVDRATEHTGVNSDKDYLNYYKTKIPRYRSFFLSGDYQLFFGFNQMRVLCITVDKTRLDKLKAVTEKMGGGHQFWFTTIDEIATPNSALTKPIWHVAGQIKKESLIG